MLIKLGCDFFVGDGEAEFFGEFHGVGVFFGFGEGGSFVFCAESFDVAFRDALSGLAFDGGYAASIKHQVI